MIVCYQEDLSEDDVMLLDNGSALFAWFGKNASEMEKKLSLKSAQVQVIVMVCVCECPTALLY